MRNEVVYSSQPGCEDRPCGPPRISTRRKGAIYRKDGPQDWLHHHTHPGVCVIVVSPALLMQASLGVLWTREDREGFRRRIIFDTIAEGIGLNRLTRNFELAVPFIDEAFR